MANFGGNFIIAPSNSSVFSNSLCNDLLFYTSNSSQRILFGNSIGCNSSILINSNTVLLNQLGINNSNPQYSLDIIGDINLSGRLLKSNNYYNANQWSNNGSNIYILGSNIGIKNTNPLYTLDINGSLNISCNILFNNSNKYLASQWSNIYNSIYLCNLVGINCMPNYPIDVNGNINFDGILKNCNNPVSFPYTGTAWSNSGCNLFILNSAIGIANSNPSATVDVNGSLSISSNLNTPGGILVQGLCILPNNGNSVNVNTTTVSGINANISNTTFMGSNYIKFIASNNIILTPSNVGVGIQNPLYALDILGNVNLTGAIRTQGNSIITNSWKNNNSNVYILSNIGINNSNPLYTLDITGNVNFRCNVNINGTLTINNSETITSNSIIYNSSFINSNLNVYNNTTLCNGLNIYGTANTNSILPLSNLTYNIGSSNMRFGSLYIASNTIDMGSLKLTTNNGNLSILDSNNSNNTLVVNKLWIGCNVISVDNNSNINFSNNSTGNIAVGGWSNSSSNIFIINSNIAIKKSNAAYNLDIAGTLNVSNINNLNPNIVMSGIITGDSNNSVFINTNTIFSTISPISIYSATQNMIITGSLSSGTIWDSNFNAYIVGSYYSNAPNIFNSNGISSGLTLSSSCNNNGYIVKYNSNGTASWATSISGTGSAITLDTNSNVIITGSYDTTAPVIYNASGTIASGLAALPTPSNSAVYVVQYNNAGSAQWNAAIDSAGLDTSYNIKTDSSNNIYIAGVIGSSNPVVYDVFSSNMSTNSVYTLSAYGAVTTIAGNTTTGSNNGTGTNASFNQPYGIKQDSIGNLYVIECTNNLIRKITQNGVVTTVAGNGTATYLDGNGTLSGFNNLTGIVIDSNNNLYVSDYGNKRIRKITSTGIVTTFAGSGTSTYLDGTGTNASFGSTYQICIDNTGNFYVSDSIARRIRKITSTGVVTTIAGSGTATYLDGTGTNAGFNGPGALTIDSTNNLYIFDSNRIRKLNLTTLAVTTLAGSGTTLHTDGTGTNASFYYTIGLSIDITGNLYACDSGDSRLRKITSTGIVTTIAGTGTATQYDGTGTLAGFNGISACTIDSSGNLYITDNNSIIRKMELNGVQVTTLAGTGTGTYLDGNGQFAGFNTPYGACVDSNNNIYIADAGNNRIRKITPAGIVTTIAGSGTATYLDGTGTNASFNYPSDVIMDNSGNIYVCDSSGCRIRKINNTGIVTTLAGSGGNTYLDGTGTNAVIKGPVSLTIDSNGNVYVVDNTSRVRKITSSGVVTTIAGNGTATYFDATGTNAGFNIPGGIVIDSNGNIFVCDSNNHRIRKITSSGVVTTFAGNGTGTLLDGLGTNSSFNYPQNISIDNLNNIYVADLINHSIRKITPSGVVSTLAGNGTATYLDGTNKNSGFYNPVGITLDSLGNIYVLEQTGSRIRKISAPVIVTTLAGGGSGNGVYGLNNGIGTNASFSGPFSLTSDSNGNIYVTETGTASIRKINISTRLVTTIAGNGVSTYADGIGTNASFAGPQGITIDSIGNLYIADLSDNHIRKITSTGIVTTFAGSGTATFVDGNGTNAGFNTPRGLSVDSSGNIYVADSGNYRIRKITSTGIVTTIAGNGTSTYLDGIGTNASFANPVALVVDLNANIYVSDLGNNRIRKISNSGIVTTLAGSGTATFLNGTGTIAGFNRPWGLTIDLNSNIYVTDQNNNNIRKITSAGVVTTLAGSGTATLYDGNGTNAGFNGPTGITIDSSGNLYISDLNIRKISMLSSITTSNSFSLVSSSNSSLCNSSGFVVKYSSNGVSQWGLSILGASNKSISIDSNNNIYIVGQYGPSASTIYLNNTSNMSLPAVTSNSTFALKVNNLGSPQWYVNIAGYGNNNSTASTIDTNGNLYITGSYIDSNAIVSSNITLPYVSNASTYLVKYNSNGLAQWANVIASSGSNIGSAITTDASNNVYLSGNYLGSLNTLPSSTTNSSYIIKYNSNGNPLSALAIIGSNYISGLSVDPYGSNIFAGGYMIGSNTFYNGATNVVYPSLSNQSSFVSSYNMQSTSFNLLSSLSASNTGQLKYITNIGSSNVIVNITNSNNTSNLNSYTISPGYNVILTWLNNSWYNLYTGVPIVGGSGGSGFSNITYSNQGNGFITYITNNTYQNYGRLSDEILNSLSSSIYDIGFYITATTSTTSSNSLIYNYNQTSNISISTGSNAYIVRYNSNYNPIWSARITSVITESTCSATVDGGVIILTRNTGGTGATVYDSSGSNYSPAQLSGAPGYSPIIIKLNYNGIYQWSSSVWGTGSNVTTNIATDINNACIIQFYALSAPQTYTVHDSGNNTYSPLSLNSSYSNDAYIIKFNSNGNFQWASRAGNTAGQTYSHSCGFDNNGNVYLATGNSTSNISIIDGISSSYTLGQLVTPQVSGSLIKYNSNGVYQWASLIYGNNITIYNISIRTDGMICCACPLTGNASVMDSSSTIYSPVQLSNNTGYNPTIVTFNSNGIYKWSIGTNSNAMNNWACKIVTDSNYNVYLSSVNASSSNIVIYDSINNIYYPTNVGGATTGCLYKFNSNGIFQWAIKPSTYASSLSGLALLADGSIITSFLSSASSSCNVSCYDKNGSLVASVTENGMTSFSTIIKTITT